MVEFNHNVRLLRYTCFEEFINSIYLSLIDSSFSQYYLADECYCLDLNKTDSIQLNKFIDNIAFQELIHKTVQDTLPIKWNCSKINKSKCVNRDTANSIILKTILYKQDRKIDKIPQQEQLVYFFTRPIFTDNDVFSIIAMGYNCGLYCGYRCTFLFKKINGEWIKLAESSCFIK